MISVDEEIFKSFAFFSAILACKMFVVAMLTGRQRIRKKVKSMLIIYYLYVIYDKFDMFKLNTRDQFNRIKGYFIINYESTHKPTYQAIFHQKFAILVTYSITPYIS